MQKFFLSFFFWGVTLASSAGNYTSIKVKAPMPFTKSWATKSYR